MRHLLGHPELNLAFSVSATTRPPWGLNRTGGLSFFDRRGVRRAHRCWSAVEWEEVYPGKFYGTLHTELERLWAAGKTVFDADVVGGANLRRMLGDSALAIFIQPPSLKYSAIGWKAEERTIRIGLKNGWPKPNGSWSSTFTSTKPHQR